MRVYKRLPVASIPLALGASIPQIKIDRVSDYDALFFRFSGTLATSLAWAGVMPDGLANIVKRIKLSVNGNTPLFDGGLRHLVNNPERLFITGRPSVSALINPVIAPTAVEAEAFLDLSAYATASPHASTLRAPDYSSVTLDIAFGTLTDIFSGAGISTLTGTLDIIAYCAVEVPFVGVDGVSRTAAPLFRRKFTRNSYQTAAATASLRIPLSPEQVVRGVNIRTTDLNGATLGNYLDNIKLYVGSDLRCDVSASALREAAQSDMNSAPNVGYYWLDLIPNFGIPADLFSSPSLYKGDTGNQDAYLVVATNSACAIEVLEHGFEFAR